MRNNTDVQGKFYNKSWFMWVTLIFFAPVGIFLVWKNKRFSKNGRIVATIVFGVLFIAVINNPNGEIPTQTAEKTVATGKIVPAVKEKTTQEIKKEDDVKIKSDAKVKTDADAKVIADQKIKDDAAAKEIADAKVIEDKKVADAKAKTAAKAISDAKAKTAAKATTKTTRNKVVKTVTPTTDTAVSDDAHVTVYYVGRSKVYHLSKSDSTLSKSKNIKSMTLKQAKEKGMHQSESKADQ